MSDNPSDRRSAIKKITGLFLASSTFHLFKNESEASSSDSKKFRNKTIFITGASNGIGRAAALAFADEGANIIAVDITHAPHKDDTNAKSTEELVKSRGVGCIAISADVRSSQQLDDAVHRAVSRFGFIDVLVASAGVSGKLGSIELESDENWQNVIDINLGGVSKSIRAVSQQMIKQKKGNIIAISSMVGRAGTPFRSAYSASKWGVIGLAKCAAIDLGRHGIRVNVIAPSVVNTPGSRGMHESLLKMLREAKLNYPPHSPLEKTELTAKDVAALILLLADNYSENLSGTVIDLQSGINAFNLG